MKEKSDMKATIYILYSDMTSSKWTETPRRAPDGNNFSYVLHSDADDVITEYAAFKNIPDNSILEVTLSTEPLIAGLKCKWLQHWSLSDENSEYMVEFDNRQWIFSLCDTLNELLDQEETVKQFWVKLTLYQE